MLQIYLQDKPLDMKLVGPKDPVHFDWERYGHFTMRPLCPLAASARGSRAGFSMFWLSSQAVPVGQAAVLRRHLLYLRPPVLRPSWDHHPLLRVPRAGALGAGRRPVRAHHAGLHDVWVEDKTLCLFAFPKGTQCLGLSWTRACWNDTVVVCEQESWPAVSGAELRPSKVVKWIDYIYGL